VAAEADKPINRPGRHIGGVVFICRETAVGTSERKARQGPL
jgi:hypothetical protein